MRLLQQIRGVNPFQGDIIPSRVALLRKGQPSLPFPHPWNYDEPIRILETFFWNLDSETESGRHNRYISIPGFPYVLVTREPAVIKAVLSDTGDKPGQFDRDTSPARGIARATGEDSLLYANGELWRRQKKIAACPFSRSSLFQPEQFQEFEQTFRATVSERLDLLRARQKESGNDVVRIALEPEIQAVMLEMLVNNFFGGSVSSDELRNRYVPGIVRLINYMVSDTVIPRSRNLFRYLGTRGEALKQDKKDFDRLTDIALAGRSEECGLWRQFKSDVPNEKLRSNIRVFLAGALEATTSFATWALSHLSRNVDLQERVYEEVKDIDTYNPENLEQASMLNRVLEETLRLTPSLYFLPRRATQDTWIETADKRRMLIPAGTHIMLDVWHANRCEDFWGENICGYKADAFAPGRWDVLEAQGKGLKDILHFGFGYGPRVCPGKFLGMLEVGLVVGAIIKIFKFTAVESNVAARAGVSTKPSDGVLVDLRLR